MESLGWEGTLAALLDFVGREVDVGLTDPGGDGTTSLSVRGVLASAEEIEIALGDVDPNYGPLLDPHSRYHKIEVRIEPAAMLAVWDFHLDHAEVNRSGPVPLTLVLFLKSGGGVSIRARP